MWIFDISVAKDEIPLLFSFEDGQQSSCWSGLIFSCVSDLNHYVGIEKNLSTDKE